MLIKRHKKRISDHPHGGLTHIRYAHVRRPTLIEVKCPRCQGCAVATDESHALGELIVMDLSPYWRSDYSLRCTSCMYRESDVAYADLPERFHQISIQGRTLWAWNREHLLMIRKVLRGERLDGDPYAFLATYIHRDWKLWRFRFSRALDRWLKVQ